MKFMGDFPLKGQTEQDLVATILKVLTSNVLHFGEFFHQTKA